MTFSAPGGVPTARKYEEAPGQKAGFGQTLRNTLRNTLTLLGLFLGLLHLGNWNWLKLPIFATQLQGHEEQARTGFYWFVMLCELNSSHPHSTDPGVPGVPYINAKRQLPEHSSKARRDYGPGHLWQSLKILKGDARWSRGTHSMFWFVLIILKLYWAVQERVQWSWIHKAGRNR